MSKHHKGIPEDWVHVCQVSIHTWLTPEGQQRHSVVTDPGMTHSDVLVSLEMAKVHAYDQLMHGT